MAAIFNDGSLPLRDCRQIKLIVLLGSVNQLTQYRNVYELNKMIDGIVEQHNLIRLMLDFEVIFVMFDYIPASLSSGNEI